MPRPLLGPVVLPRPLPNNGGGAGAFEIFELGGGGGTTPGGFGGPGGFGA